MRRIVTLDVIRGGCIIAMVAVHVFAAIFDRSWVMTQEMSSKTLLDILFLIAVAYLGGMTGLFLMVSTIAHTLTIREQLKEGRDLRSVMVRQLVSGLMLLAFAFLVESTIGYHGFLGRMANYDPFGPQSFASALSGNVHRIYYRGYHFMTLQTIAWSMIINTLVQWWMYRRDRRLHLTRNTAAYIIMIVAVILLTPLAWKLADAIVPGYPFETYPGTDRMVQYPLEGVSTPLDYFVLFFLGPIAGQTEPLFPFLFIAFIGAIIGLHLSQERLSAGFCRKGMQMGIVMFIVGFIGLQIFWVLGLDSWTNLTRNTFNLLKLDAWMPLLLLSTGGQLVIVFLILRLVEFRGIASEFARRTKVIRMFGAVSLSIYTFHYIDALPRFVLDLIPGIEVFGERDGLITTIVVMIIILIMWWLLLSLWAKFHFVFSVEWAFAKALKAIGRLMFKGDKKQPKKRERWYYVPKLDLFSKGQSILWMDFEANGNEATRVRRDINLSLVLSVIGIFLLPFAMISFLIARGLLKNRSGDHRLRSAMSLARAGLVIGVVKLLILAVTQNVVF